MTPTPRTDAAVARMQFSNAPHDLDGKFADFARELECENARLREALELLAHWSRSKTETRISLRNRIDAALLPANPESKP